MSFFKASSTPSKQAVSRIPKCGSCKLFKGCQSPKMKPSGKGRKGILLVGEFPSAVEDERGVHFVGDAGRHLESHLLDVGIDMRKDCWITNCIICHPLDNKIPSPKVINYCRPTLFNTIDQLKPNIIICFGLTAVKSLIGHLWREDVGPMARWAGWRIPSQKPNAWICPTYHPSYLLRENNPVLELHFAKHLAAAVELQGRPWQKLPEYQKQVQVVENPTEAARLLRGLIKRKLPLVAFDYETDRLKPDSKEATIVTCAVSDGETTLSYPWHGEAVAATKELLTDPDIKKTAHNAKFEHRWSKAVLGIEVKPWAYCSMVGSHILDNRRGVTGLKFQAFVRFGQPSYNDYIEPYLKQKNSNQPNKIWDADFQKLLLYGALDAKLQYELAVLQMKEMTK